MKIKESKNLKYDKFPWARVIEEYERFEPRICILERFTRTDDLLRLYFKNGSQAVITTINIEGGREIDLIENKLNEFLGRSYEEILDVDF
ncbi:MAG: hypothetical protein C0412_20925 [Flavobacterium sp.]|nr:hypothetical protein [Flavobacterium sp.]